MKLTALFFACTMVSIAPAHADDHPPAADHRVTCVDPATGTSRWEADVGPLGVPTLSIASDRLVIDDEHAGHVELSLATGKRVTRPRRAPGAAIPALAFERPLTWRGRHVFEYVPGTTRDLRVTAPTTWTARLLEAPPRELVVVGDHAIFTMADTLSPVGNGEVYAFDLKRNRLSWETSVVPAGTTLVDGGVLSRFDHHHTAIWSDGQAVYVGFDQTITALEPATGAVRWRRDLPRQALRRYDTPRTRMARAGGHLFAVVYEDLFVLDPKDGRLLWSVDAGPHTEPAPVVGASAVCLAVRRGPVPAVGMTVSAPAKPARRLLTTLKLVRRGNQFSVTAIERDAVPPGAPIWWSLQPPPPSSKDAVLLELRGADRPLTLDVGGVLSRDGVAFIKFANPWFKTASLTRGGRAVATARWNQP